MNPKEYLKTYNKLKAKYPDTIILIDTGMDYITFNEDASEICSLLCNKLQTTKDEISIRYNFVNKCSIDVDIKRLVKKGHKVALCSRLE